MPGQTELIWRCVWELIWEDFWNSRFSRPKPHGAQNTTQSLGMRGIGSWTKFERRTTFSTSLHALLSVISWCFSFTGIFYMHEIFSSFSSRFFLDFHQDILVMLDNWSMALDAFLWFLHGPQIKSPSRQNILLSMQINICCWSKRSPAPKHLISCSEVLIYFIK